MDKKESILNAALALFVENGFHGTATSKIAEESGVSNGTLFNYFKTKDELVVAVYVHLKSELADYILKNTAQSDETKDVMKSQFLASLFWGLDNSIKFRFIQQFHASPYLKKVEKAEIEKQLRPHLAVIEKGIAEKLLKTLPVDLIYALVLSQAFGLYQYLMATEPSKVETHDLVQKTFDLLWDMLT